MFRITEDFKALDGPQAWKDVAGKEAETRWEYAHSPFHAAGYALDPEYWEELLEEGLEQEGLEAVKAGLEVVVERCALREELKVEGWRSNRNTNPRPCPPPPPACHPD
eukprot:3528498-Prymnesium_polylepis.2